MHFAFDASRVTVAHRTGTERYALNLLSALWPLCQAHGHTATFYLREPDRLGALPPTAPTQVIGPPRLWTHWALARALHTRPPSALFVPAHVLPLPQVMRPAFPMLVTVHDVGYRHFPHAHPVRQRLYLELGTWFSARGAAGVLADSHATARDLTRFYGTPAEKIHVVYPGRDEALAPTDPTPVRAKYGLTDYVLCVGTLQPRKNILRLLEAWQALDPPGVNLVLAGRAGWLAQAITQRVADLHPRVRWLDSVPDADLPGLYSGALALAFPSLYEGFGFPALEAMQCGAPVLAANTSSLPEVVGEAAVLIDPLDMADLVRGLRAVLADETLRARLRAAGLVQARRFSWARAATETFELLLSACSASPL